MVSKLYGVDATIIILLFVLYCIISTTLHHLLSTTPPHTPPFSPSWRKRGGSRLRHHVTPSTTKTSIWMTSYGSVCGKNTRWRAIPSFSSWGMPSSFLQELPTRFQWRFHFPLVKTECRLCLALITPVTT